jgi:hypothetical protein
MFSLPPFFVFPVLTITIHYYIYIYIYIELTLFLHLSSKMGRWDLILRPPKREPFKVPPHKRGRKLMDTVRSVPAPTTNVSPFP